jgi:hypothetical protein
MWVFITDHERQVFQVGFYTAGEFSPVFNPVYEFKQVEQAEHKVNYLNGGMDIPAFVRSVDRILETLQQFSDNIVKQMTFRDWQ